MLENLSSVSGKVHPSPPDPQVSSIAPVFWLNGQLALDLYRASPDGEEIRQLERIEPVSR
jgi:hypothetical protein